MVVLPSHMDAGWPGGSLNRTTMHGALRNKARLATEANVHINMTRGAPSPRQDNHDTQEIRFIRHPGKSLYAAIYTQQCTHKVPDSSSQEVHRRMQLTLFATSQYTHGASRLIEAVSDGWVKTRRAPSRRCNDARTRIWSQDCGHACQ